MESSSMGEHTRTKQSHTDLVIEKKMKKLTHKRNKNVASLTKAAGTDLTLELSIVIQCDRIDL